MLPNARVGRLAIGLIGASAAFFGGLGIVVAQSNPQAALVPALLATPPPVVRLAIGALGGAVFEPLVTYHAPAMPAQKGTSIPKSVAADAVSLCMTLSGHPPIAVLSLGATTYESKFEQESLGGRRIQTIGDGWVRFDDATTLVQSNCVGGGAATAATMSPGPTLPSGSPVVSGGVPLAPSFELGATPVPALFTPPATGIPNAARPIPAARSTP